MLGTNPRRTPGQIPGGMLGWISGGNPQIINLWILVGISTGIFVKNKSEGIIEGNCAVNSQKKNGIPQKTNILKRSRKNPWKDSWKNSRKNTGIIFT